MRSPRAPLWLALLLLTSALRVACGGELRPNADDPAACPAGAAPLGGFCPGPEGFYGARLRCGSRCVDPQTDPSHCGACGRTCAPGEACDEGRCTTACPSWTRSCGGRCAATGSDPSHCGGCGRACQLGEYCGAGRCLCEVGLRVCWRSSGGSACIAEAVGR